MAAECWQPDLQGVGKSSQVQQQGSSAEITLLWPPCIEVGQAAQVSVQLACTTCCGPSPDDGTTGTPAPANFTPPAWKGVPCMEEPSLVVISAPPALSEAAWARVRQVSTCIRMLERSMGVLTVAVSQCPADPQGPSLHSLCAAACLPVLPPVACQEIRELLWCMMCEALPPHHDKPAYDPQAFISPFELLPIKYQHAMRWAWCNHFRPFALDLHYCFNLIPQSEGAGAGAGGLSDYQAVLAPMITFLRDHQYSVTLAALLSSCIRQGLAIISPATPWSLDDCEVASPDRHTTCSPHVSTLLAGAHLPHPTSPCPAPPPSPRIHPTRQPMKGEQLLSDEGELSDGFVLRSELLVHALELLTQSPPATAPPTCAPVPVPPAQQQQQRTSHSRVQKSNRSKAAHDTEQRFTQSRILVFVLQLLVLVALRTTGVCGLRLLLCMLLLLAGALFAPDLHIEMAAQLNSRRPGPSAG